MKPLVRLAVLILFGPALLLAQTSAGAATAGSQANDNGKPVNAQTAPAGAQQPATAPSSSQSGQKQAAPATDTAKQKAPAPYPVMSTKAKERARQLYDYFTHDQVTQLYASFAPGMKKQSTEARISAMRKDITVKLGAPGQVLSENFLPSLGAPVTMYTRTTTYSKVKVPVVIALAIDTEGQLTDFQILPIQSPPRDEYTDYQDATKLHLPFNSDWTVLQGGRTIYDNAFAATEEGRYTVGFMFLKDGAAFENDGKRNTDYYCFGQPILSPAAGVVVQEGAGAQDHAPGRPSDVMSHGNYVVIAHGNSEYSLIPYLKAGSMKVKLGQHVKQGDVVGQCGNTGSSFAPHVEYSLQNTRGFPLPKTLPAQFVDYVADGKPVPVGEPLRGQVVSNQSKATAMETAEKP